MVAKTAYEKMYASEGLFKRWFYNHLFYYLRNFNKNLTFLCKYVIIYTHWR
jgi:hypothetical protein